MRAKENPAALAQLNRKLGDNIESAGEMLLEAIKQAISIQGPPASKPGEPPHIESGKLIESWEPEIDRDALVARIASDVPHSVYLEIGTDTIEPRPYVAPTLMTKGDELAREIAKP